MTRVAGLILSGGKSSRMGGGQKALLPLDGASLIDRSIRRLSDQVGAIAVSANEPEPYGALDLPLLPDTLSGHLGPLAGVLAGLRWGAGQNATHICSVAADTPFFPLDLVARLTAGLSAAHPIAMAATANGRHPTFALWPVERADALERALRDGLRKIIAWSDEVGCASIAFDDAPYDPFFNVNTPDDMKAAERMVAEHGM